jgi:hypothetical protein
VRALIRQLLTESVMLGLAGGVGRGVAWLGEAVDRNQSANIPRLSEINIDLRASFTLLVSVLTGLVFKVSAGASSLASLTDEL